MTPKSKIKQLWPSLNPPTPPRGTLWPNLCPSMLDFVPRARVVQASCHF